MGPTTWSRRICQKSTLPVRLGTACGANSSPNEYDFAFSGCSSGFPPCIWPSCPATACGMLPLLKAVVKADRKSTRLNSSHSQISYAVFCLKKKKKKHETSTTHNHIHSHIPTHLRCTAM